MKIAFISDIHANFPALIEALETAKRLGAAETVIAGDFIGGGPHPVEVIRTLKRLNVKIITGNLEREVVELAAHKTGKKGSKKKKGKKANTIWTVRQLDEDDIEWLSGLPTSIGFRVEDVDVLVVHGSPESDQDNLYPSITPMALKSLTGGLQAHLLICGHTHIPFTKRLGHHYLINCGSVGRPVDGDTRGSFALVDFPGGGILKAKIIRFRYEMDSMLEDLTARGVPGVVPDEYRKGIKRKGA